MENSSHSLWGTEKQAQQLCVQRSAALHGDLLYFCVWPQQVWTFQGRNRNLENKRTQPFYSHQSLNDKHTTASVAREIRHGHQPGLLIISRASLYGQNIVHLCPKSNLLVICYYQNDLMLGTYVTNPAKPENHASLGMGHTITHVSSISSQWALGEAYDQCLGESLKRDTLRNNYVIYAHIHFSICQLLEHWPESR